MLDSGLGSLCEAGIEVSTVFDVEGPAYDMFAE